MGIILKLIDNGNFGAFGRNTHINSTEFAAEKWEPMMNRGMILAYVGFSVGITLAIITFIIELFSGQCEKGLKIICEGIIILSTRIAPWYSSLYRVGLMCLHIILKLALYSSTKIRERRQNQVPVA